ncbi:TonB-dependent receptor [Agrobacterium sp. rho-13.3]|uniref:TonB-dependent receptor n=1 Tax=Agrobacterium sp. rho-13.3 TaxID=3072980 RepID=UPI002A0AB6C2|nr:TonB-dependent receptor [Agrobacterium sp. rho-13.3]MDX8306702.1 TonB-dependent receptor [Agrobacterium sp. rho-13.3]MDX8306967.1 TonB-dependent receptor [Agrobacterium sp. rho-13.3]
MSRKIIGGASVCAFAVSAMMSTGAVAQEQVQADQSQKKDSNPSATVLETIVVTGGRTPQQISETAKTIYVVEGDEISAQANAGKSLQQILADTVPSFDPGSEGARTSFGQNLRGRTALVLIDGVSLNSARALGRQFDSIDPFNIARVEVLSGATSIYGGNATGGIINIITKKGKNAEPGLHSEITTGVKSGFGGSQDFDRNAKAAVTYNAENWDARLSIAGNRDGAFYDSHGDMVMPDVTQTSTAFNKRLDIMGSAGFQFDDTRRLEISGQYFDSKQDPDYGLFYGAGLAGFGNPSLFEARSGYESDFNPRTRRKMVNATYTDDDFLDQQLLVQGAFRREELQFAPFTSGTYFSGTSQDTDYYTVRAALVAEPLDGLKITYGVDADHDSFSSTQNIFNFARAAATGGLDFDTIGITGRYPDIDVSTIAGFAEASYEATDKLTLSGGVRYQFVHTKVGNFVGVAQQIAILQGTLASADAIPGGTVNYDDFLFNVGATYEVTNTQQVYANFSQGFELPDPAKYYGVGRYSGGTLLSSVNVAQSALQAIKTNSFEIGYRLDDGTYNLETAAYYSLSNKSINLNSTTLAVELKDEDKRVYGIEGKVGAKLDYGFDTGLFGQWVKTEVKGTSGWQDATVQSASVSKLGGYVGWTDDALSLKFAGQHIFDLTDAQNFKIDGYTLFDLTGSYKFETANTTLNFGIQNLFDTDYTTIWGSRSKALYSGLVGSAVADAIFDYKGRGRTFGVSLTKVF